MPDEASPDQLSIRLVLDHHIKARLADDLHERGYDVVTAQDMGMERASDEELLAFAALEKRSLLTFNIQDFASCHEQWIQTGRTHAGIIVSRLLGSRQYGILLARVLRLLNQLDADQIRGTLIHLEQFRE